MCMNPSILFNSSIAFIIAGLILLFNKFFVLGITSLVVSITAGVVWFMSGLFDKFESTPPETESLDDKDEEGKGVLKPF